MFGSNCMTTGSFLEQPGKPMLRPKTKKPIAHKQWSFPHTRDSTLDAPRIFAREAPAPTPASAHGNTLILRSRNIIVISDSPCSIFFDDLRKWDRPGQPHLGPPAVAASSLSSISKKGLSTSLFSAGCAQWPREKFALARHKAHAPFESTPMCPIRALPPEATPPLRKIEAGPGFAVDHRECAGGQTGQTRDPAQSLRLIT